MLTKMNWSCLPSLNFILGTPRRPLFLDIEGDTYFQTFLGGIYSPLKFFLARKTSTFWLSILLIRCTDLCAQKAEGRTLSLHARKI